MYVNKEIEAAIAGAAEQRRITTGRELAAWEITSMRKQLTQQQENSGRRLQRLRSFSSAGRIATELCVNCNTKPARWDSIYCSDSCKAQFLTPREPAKHTVVERWTGQNWIAVKLTWNGTEYKEVA